SVFFFSSRRRHTRSKRDWSSDVCSSDLIPAMTSILPSAVRARAAYPRLHRGRDRRAMCRLLALTIARRPGPGRRRRLRRMRRRRSLRPRRRRRSVVPRQSSGLDRRVAGILDRGEDLCVIEGLLGGDDEAARLGADLNVSHPGELTDLLADGHLAVPTGHSGHLVLVRRRHGRAPLNLYTPMGYLSG